MQFYLSVLICLIFRGEICAEEIAEDTLVLVHAIVRHGKRYPEPTATFPNDIHKNVTFYPYGTGELNREGTKDVYQLGKELRRRYESFLGPEYHPEMLEATSSGYTRCRMTMQLLLASIFPPHQTQSFQDGLSWQPIPYRYTDRNTDLMIGSMRCAQASHKMTLKEEFNKCQDRNYLYKYLTEHTGFDVDALHKVFMVYDTLKAQQENGLSLPTWAVPIWPEPLQTCSNDFWRHVANNKTVVGNMGALFIKKILDDTMQKIKENSTLEKRKMFLYTVHEPNIYIFLSVLNNYNDTIPNYLANVIFEVHKIKGVYGFKFYFDNRDGIGLRLLEIPKYGTFCPVDKFYKLMEFYINSEPCPP